MRYSLWTIVAVILLATGGYLGFIALRPTELPPGFLYGSGRIEATELRLAAEIPGRVVENQLVEGQPIIAGDELIRLDDRLVRLQQAELEARLIAGEQSVVRLERMLDTARHHLGNAEADLERARTLRRSGTIPAQQLERSEDRVREAAGEVEGLQAQRAEAAANLEALRQQRSQLALQLDKTVLHSPIAATVLVKAVEIGEVVAPGQSLGVLVDLDRPRLKIYVTEQVLGRIRLGTPARVRVNAFPDRHFEAEVSAIDSQAQFTPRDVHLPDERAHTVFGVTLQVANPDGVLKPGMPADAWLRWQDEVPWPDTLVVPP
ncbi:HlyD family efflux transporter periplasmic adaptor subunit [Billgrantia diversa]|uniref:HlyD family secretion protein n=1 Tax=Halomonas sp. MCCC 1A13316 TaxID=2733487 RepID=UPI0018A5A6B2|nr:efflux RND transporter periplasmic adaptor subunit [Halomonas sp. MCCC 1A13316]QOR38190.1 HlyD family efflux transporter periplasmic adaptor subunit [Halomonas sp. MCCC 1A13316]